MIEILTYLPAFDEPYIRKFNELPAAYFDNESNMIDFVTSEEMDYLEKNKMIEASYRTDHSVCYFFTKKGKGWLPAAAYHH